MTRTRRRSSPVSVAPNSTVSEKELRVLQASTLFKWIDSGADEKKTNASSVTMYVCMCVCV